MAVVQLTPEGAAPPAMKRATDAFERALIEAIEQARADGLLEGLILAMLHLKQAQITAEILAL